MLLPEIVDFIKNDIKPVELTTPDETVAQMVQTAIRYFNVHSAYKISRMYSASQGTVKVPLESDFKEVVRVYPATNPDTILQNFPLWTLLGITIIDNLSSDLIELAEGYKNYRYYIGSDFTFHYEQSESPTVGGSLYLSNLPYNTTRICVVGTKRIRETEDITSEYILDWLLQYSRALVLIQEGMTLRKADIIGIKNDGDAMIKENMEIKKDLQKELTDNGRWFGFVRRF